MRQNLNIWVSLLAIALLFIPLQKFFPLARYQHFGIASFVFGFGYLLHLMVNWKNLKKWGRRTYLVCGCFFISIAIFFITSPWLDFRVNLQTEEQQFFVKVMTIGYTICGILIGYVWWRAFKERNQ